MRIVSILRHAVAAVFLFSIASLALGQGAPPGGGPMNQHPDIKTPPLTDSDTFVIPIRVHNPFDTTSWAGMAFKLHILDNTEMDVTMLTSSTGGVTPVPPFTASPPMGPPSDNITSVARYFNAWHPRASASGTPAFASSSPGTFGITIHAKNTTIANNSDIDMTAMWGNIYHLLPGPGSTLVSPSVWVWAPSNFNPTPNEPLPFQKPATNSPNAQWKHLNFSWHVPSGTGSNFVATFANKVNIGIEHVPEPSAGILLLAVGAICVGGSQLKKRFGKQQTK